MPPLGTHSRWQSPDLTIPTGSEGNAVRSRRTSHTLRAKTEDYKDKICLWLFLRSSLGSCSLEKAPATLEKGNNDQSQA